MKFRMLTLVIIFSAGLSAVSAYADFRYDAKQLIDRLQSAGADKKKPAEVASATATFAAAENYYSSNQKIMAEKYYLLAAQKARIVLTSIPDAMTGLPENRQPETVSPGASPAAQSAVPMQDGMTPEPPVPTVTGNGYPPQLPAEQPSKPENMPSDDKSADTGTVTAAGDEQLLPQPIVSDKITGGVGFYTVVKGDSLSLVSAKLGVSRSHLAKENRLASDRAPLHVGQRLRYNNRKIIPQRVKNGIIINVPDRTLYYFKKGKLVLSLPVALGVPVVNEKYDWRTPLGKFRITAKVKEPTWYVPPSIQSEMEENGKEVITSIPPGPDNPLGQYAMKTSLPGILIHSTIKPGSVYGFASHGCIRVYPERMEELFKEVAVSTSGEIIYRPVKLAVTEDGNVLLEAHKDVYNQNIVIAKEARALIEKYKLADRVDWQKVEQVVRQKAGIAEDVTKY